MKPFSIVNINGPLYVANKVWLERDLPVLQRHGIGAIVNLMEDYRYEAPPPLVCLESGFPDDIHVTAKQLEEIYSFIDRHRLQTHVLIHCSAGVSRSAGVVTGQLMRENPGWSWKQALNVVNASRSVWVAVEMRESVITYLENRVEPVSLDKIRDEDAQVLHRLGTAYGIGLREVRRIGWDTQGFTIKDGYVVGLGLCDANLSCIPGEIQRLTRLQDLYLCDNRIETIPEWIVGLVHLRTLYLSDNQLGSLPDEIGTLTGLRVLNLARNLLGRIPDAIQNLHNLDELYLHNNRIACLPEGFSQLDHVSELCLRNNQLVHLPEDLGYMSGLQQLALSGNLICRLPESIGDLLQLRQLTLAKNQLTQLPPGLGRLTALDNLNISSNHLGTVPDSIIALKRLRRLNIAFNHIRCLPSALEQWIEDLQARGCIVLR